MEIFPQAIEAEAKKGQGRRWDLVDDNIRQNSAECESLETRKELAEKAGVSHDTISRVEKIKEHANEETSDKMREAELVKK